MMPNTPPPVVLREPQPNELTVVNDLILRSKAVWGYDEAFMAACIDELAITPDLLTQHHFMVATQGDAILGVVEISADGDDGHLEKLFIEPDVMQTGAGRKLFDWAVGKSKELGVQTLSIEADPGAEGFYAKMGAVRIGDVPSGSIAGRMLPLLRYTIS